MGPPLPHRPDSPPVRAPPTKSVPLPRGSSFFSASFSTTSNISAAPTKRLTASGGSRVKPRAPRAARGRAVREKSPASRQRI